MTRVDRDWFTSGKHLGDEQKTSSRCNCQLKETRNLTLHSKTYVHFTYRLLLGKASDCQLSKEGHSDLLEEVVKGSWRVELKAVDDVKDGRSHAIKTATPRRDEVPKH